MPRLTPSGTHGQDVANGDGGVVTGVNKTGTGTIKYSTTHGFSRGNEVSIHVVSNAVADQANFQIDDTDQPWATNQVYQRWPKWPTAGGTVSANTEFLANRANGNSARLIITATGTVLLQNATGGSVGTWTGTLGSPPQLALNQEYRFRLKSTPGNSSTTGQATAEIWNADTDELVAAVTVTGQNFGGTSTNLNHTSGRYCDPSTTVGADFETFLTMPEFQTGATSAPDLAAVAKNATNTAPTVTADKASYEADETVTLTIADAQGVDTISSVVVTGTTPAPAVTGTGSTRTFITPRLTNATVLTITVTDTGGLTGSTTVTVLGARKRVFYDGQWRAYYERVRIAPLEMPLTDQVLRYKADILVGSENSEVSSLPSWNGLLPPAIQDTQANRPTLKLAALNGHNTLNFNGSQWLLFQDTALDVARNKGNLLLFVVYRLPAVEPGGARTLVSWTVGGAASGRASLYDSNGSTPRAGGRRLDTDAFNSVSGGTRVMGEAAVLCASFRWATNTLVLFKNGAQVASSSTFLTAGNTSDTRSQSGFIGVNGFNFGEATVCEIAEVVAYAQADADGTTRQGVSVYMQDTYAIPMADYVTTPPDEEGA